MAKKKTYMVPAAVEHGSAPTLTLGGGGFTSEGGTLLTVD